MKHAIYDICSYKIYVSEIVSRMPAEIKIHDILERHMTFSSCGYNFVQ